MCRLKLMVLILLHLVKNTSRNRFQRENNNKKKSWRFLWIEWIPFKFFSFQEKSLHNKRKKRPQEKNNYPQGDTQLSIFSSFYNAYCKITHHVTSKFVHLSRYERIWEWDVGYNSEAKDLQWKYVQVVKLKCGILSFGSGIIFCNEGIYNMPQQVALKIK